MPWKCYSPQAECTVLFCLELAERTQKHSILAVLQKCGCCWLLVHFSSNVQAVPSCAAMCSCTAVARGPRLVRLCSCHTFVCTHTYKETQRFVYEHMHTPFAGSCRNHMFYKNHGEVEERNMTSSDISISARKKYNCPQSVKMCCIHVSDQNHRFITEIILNIPKYRNNANLFVLGGKHLLCTLFINRQIVHFETNFCVVTQNWECTSICGLFIPVSHRRKTHLYMAFVFTGKGYNWHSFCRSNDSVTGIYWLQFQSTVMETWL